MIHSLRWWALALVCVMGSAQAQTGQITFQGAVVVPTTSSMQVASSQFTRQDTWHHIGTAKDPVLLTYALRRAPNHPVHLVTLTYF